MSRSARRLTELRARGARWSGRTGLRGEPRVDLLSDGDGLYLAVGPATKAWVLRLYINGKERRSGLGIYRDDGTGVSLREARDAAERLRVQGRATGETQADRRRAARAEAEKEAAARVRQLVTTFEPVARDWHRLISPTLTKKHGAQSLSTLEQHVFPKIGEMQLKDITTAHILTRGS